MMHLLQMPIFYFDYDFKEALRVVVVLDLDHRRTFPAFPSRNLFYKCLQRHH